MHYWHDGYYSNPEALASRVELYDKEGWRIVAILPSMKVEGVQTGASILVKHPSQRLPSWERTTPDDEPEIPFEDWLKKVQPILDRMWGGIVQSVLGEKP